MTNTSVIQEPIGGGSSNLEGDMEVSNPLEESKVEW